jgi:hypothetical protein
MATASSAVRRALQVSNRYNRRAVIVRRAAAVATVRSDGSRNSSRNTSPGCVGAWGEMNVGRFDSPPARRLGRECVRA